MQQANQELRDELAEWVRNLEKSDKRGQEYEKFSALHAQLLFGADVYQEALDALNDAIRVGVASNAVFDKMTPPTMLPPADRKIFKTALHHMRLMRYYGHEQMIEQQKVYVHFAAYGGLVKNVPRHELPTSYFKTIFGIDFRHFEPPYSDGIALTSSQGTTI